MSSISVGELKTILEDIPDDWEVLMNVRHKYGIPPSPEGWIAYINGVDRNEDYKEVRLMN